MNNAPYQLHMPAKRSTCVVFASPHSGRSYPAAFLNDSVLDQRLIRSSEDAFVDQLFAAAPVYGAPLLCAQTPRAFVDLNRDPAELDPALIEGVSRSGHNPRVASGLGVIPRVVSNGRMIYRGKILLTDATKRLNAHWYPYHSALENLLTENQQIFGESILIDCHSMPHEAIASISHPGGAKPEIVLGDRFGAACARETVDRIEAAFLAAGLNVARNTPFAGAYITQHYGRPSRNRHVVQIEIDRALYMDEQMIQPNGNFLNFQKLINTTISDIVKIGENKLPLVAE